MRFLMIFYCFFVHSDIEGMTTKFWKSMSYLQKVLSQNLNQTTVCTIIIGQSCLHKKNFLLHTCGWMWAQILRKLADSLSIVFFRLPYCVMFFRAALTTEEHAGEKFYDLDRNSSYKPSLIQLDTEFFPP